MHDQRVEFVNERIHGAIMRHLIPMAKAAKPVDNSGLGSLVTAPSRETVLPSPTARPNASLRVNTDDSNLNLDVAATESSATAESTQAKPPLTPVGLHGRTYTPAHIHTSGITHTQPVNSSLLTVPQGCLLYTSPSPRD